VVDLRALNGAVVEDSSPLRRQADIIQDLKGAFYISCIDRVYLHAATIGYVNSIHHVQCMIKNVMRNLTLVRVYVDNFVSFLNFTRTRHPTLRGVWIIEPPTLLAGSEEVLYQAPVCHGLGTEG
jgi:hypothetical protein